MRPIPSAGALLLVLFSAPGCILGDQGDGTDTGDSGTDTDTDTDTDTGVEVMPSIAFVPVRQPIDITPDGRIALLWDNFSPTADVYFYDPVSGQLDLKTSSGSWEHPVTGIAADGARISGTYGSPADTPDTPTFNAAVWSEAGGWLDLGNPYTPACDPNFGSAWDVTADGSGVVGLVWNGCDAEAFFWSDASGMGVFTPLQFLGDGQSRASVVSDDGSTAAGFASNGYVDRTPAVWSTGGPGFLLDPTANTINDYPGEVMSISADGTMVAGEWQNFDGFYWTADAGIVDIGKLPDALPDDKMFPAAIAADGQLIFGGCGDWYFGIVQGFVWTEAAGVRRLQDVAVEAGVEIPEGYILSGVMGASTDGTVLVGVAFDEAFNQMSFVLTLPVSAYGI